MIKLKDSIVIDNKNDLTIIKIGMEMPIEDYKSLDIDVDAYPRDAWEVWVLKYHDTDNPSFEVCNKGLRVARNLSKEEKTTIMKLLTEQGYERMLQKENDDAF
jgi:hypothetical protein